MSFWFEHLAGAIMGLMRRLRRLSRLSISGRGEAIVDRTPNERDFVRHLETVHRIPNTVLARLPRHALVEFHDAEHATQPKHAKPMWTTGPGA